MIQPVELARELIKRPSITPADAGCQAVIAEHLEALGFTIEWQPYGEVTNLWARRGNESPLFCFLGHTDVVPAGSESAWGYPPFQPTIEDGLLYGRGAADMKGGVAAFISALENFIDKNPDHSGSIAVLLTSDEEGDAVDGTKRVIAALEERGEKIDYCLVGEPSSQNQLADEIKVGRRGSLTGKLRIKGEQGHVAYPQYARNPLHMAVSAIKELIETHWDEGNQYFPPTSFQVSNIRAGTGADNVIPGELEISFNFRYSPMLAWDEIIASVERLLKRHELDFSIDWRHSGEPFQTSDGELLKAVEAATEQFTGKMPLRSTSGGTSDGRFVAPTGAQVIELGLLNETIHKTNENIAIADLDKLSNIYEETLTRLFG
ncbi:succinyl-diaminopimelate desuccinylase [Halorhodospira halochloris]|uniref:succinyl-diaminopimelate desuccinylase n=1 Tax=Halorhodospira halochloris TaxID=1052 RepID=UPI001EE86D53|nr:succinyl-diaminopimelate desuccinylase [Halorhodospira halochloris]MCG5547683.1 succinyl-diaminopimelate desuccinylase [Halorhodospira halochloris]